MSTELTWRKAIETVLGSSPTPLHYNDIAERIISEGLRHKIGATPAATVNAHISASIKHDGKSSPYIRVSKGTFALKSSGATAMIIPKKLTPEVAESDEEEQYEIISSFGMFWRKDAIEWGANPKLLGMQQIGATPVDFCKQFLLRHWNRDRTGSVATILPPLSISRWLIPRSRRRRSKRPWMWH